MTLFGQIKEQSQFFTKADNFLMNYVNDGWVDYNNIAKNKSELKELTGFIHSFDYSTSHSTEKAYLINVYNILVVDQLISKWPVTSPESIPGFFDANKFQIGQKKITLNALENDVLRKDHKDPRLHFVLVCGAQGCPPITDFSFLPEGLDELLDTQTANALNDNGFIYQNDAEKTIYLSEIFNWYATDFGKNKEGVIGFINKYRTNKFDPSYKIKYIPYNWSVNGLGNKPSVDNSNSVGNTVTQPILSGGNQTFNPGSLLRKKQFDFTLFNTLYTQTKSNWLGETFTGNRQTFVSNLIQITYGVSKSKRFNVGLDINFKSSGKSSDSTAAGIKNAFEYSNTDSTRYGVTSIGLKLKVQPFKSVNNLSIQSTFFVPTIEHPEGKSPTIEDSRSLYWADWDRYTWWNQLFYTKSFGKFQLFTEFDMLFRFRRSMKQITALDMPMSVFMSYFPTKKVTFYVMSQHVPRMTNNIRPDLSEDWVIGSNYTASGLGMKYQVSRGFNIELLYTNFWRGDNSGLGNTFNIGFKFLTK